VRVRDDPDARRQLLDPGRLQAGRVGAFGIGALVKRVNRRRGEEVRARLIQVQVDVGERKPRAVGLPSRVHRRRRRRHRGCGNLCGRRDIFATRECGEGGLGGGMTCGYRRASTFCPREPFGVGPVFWRGDDPFDVYVDVLLIDDLPRGGGGRCRSARRGGGGRRGGLGRAAGGSLRCSRGLRDRSCRRLRCGCRCCRLGSHGVDMDLWRPRWNVDDRRPLRLLVWLRGRGWSREVGRPRRRASRFRRFCLFGLGFRPLR
jgi:hypothetical protein